jgi:hypothetical protein
MTRRPRSAVALCAVLGAVVACPPVAAITPAEMAPHRRTLADIAEVSSAIIAWVIDQVEVQGPAVGRLGGSVDVDDYSPITVADLEALLVPAYLTEVPEVDGWGTPYDYRFDPSILTAAHLVLIRSAGADEVYESTVYTLGDVETLDEDLVWADGISVRRPGAPLIDVRSRALRARREVANISVAVLAWYVDQPGVAPLAAGGGTVDLGLFTPITAAALEALLVPAYTPTVPATDPWGTAYDYFLDTVDLLGPEVAAIRSRGRDGLAEGSVYVPGTFPALELDGDLVWADGVQVRQPDDISILVFLDGFEDGDTRHWSAAAP